MKVDINQLSSIGARRPANKRISLCLRAFRMCAALCQW